MTTGKTTSRSSDDASGATSPAGASAFQRALPIYIALLLAIGTVAGIALLLRLTHVLLIVFISVLFAAATASPSARLERLRLPRWLAVGIVYAAVLAVLGALAWFVVPPLLSQVANLADEAPAYLERYEQVRRAYDQLRAQYPTLGTFDDQLNRAGSRIVEWAGERLAELPSRIFGLIFDLVSVTVISTLLVTNRERLLAGILALTHPEQRERTATVLGKMWQRIGRYIGAKLIVMAIIGTLMFVALLILNVPFALLLAIAVALGEAIPRIGPWLARIPLLTIAALAGWTTLGLTALISVVVENLKGYVISPVIEGDQLDIHPLFVFLAVLVGSALLGVAGAFIAVPVAAMLQVLMEEVVIPWRRRQIAGDDGEAVGANAVMRGDPKRHA